MKAHEPEPLRNTVTTTFWLPFESGYQMQLSEDYAIEFADGLRLPVFLSGKDHEEYRETKEINITSHSILMGALLGYDNMYGIPNQEQEREFLADIIRQIALRVYKNDDFESFILWAAHWLREHAGLSYGRTALKTATKLAPFDMGIRIDYILICWYEAEDEPDENFRRNLLEEIVSTYQKFYLKELPEFFLQRTSYFLCAVLGLLGKHTLPGEREWYDHAVRYITNADAIEKLEQCQREGFSMEVCRTSATAAA